MNADGSFSYRAEPGFFGTDSFTFQISDGAAVSEALTVDIVVDPQLTNPGLPTITTPEPSGEPTINEPTPTTEPEPPSEPNPEPVEQSPTQEPEIEPPETTTDSETAKKSEPVAGLPGNIEADDPSGVTAADESTPQTQADQITPEAVLAGIIREVEDTARQNSGTTLSSVSEGSTESRSGRQGVEITSVRSRDPISQTVLHLDFGSLDDDVRRDEEAESEQQIETLAVGTTAVVSTGLSVGYVIWLIRGGTLLASMVSALPAWVSFDPLPILESFEEEEDLDDRGITDLI